MKHKTLRTLLCVILTVCFCLSAIVPASAAGLFGGDSGAATGWDQLIRGLKDRFIEKNPGTDETPAEPMAGAGTGGFYRIVHLDCGRKYFSVENIKKLIDTMAQYGYNQLQLAFGNDGFRFLLDDMSLSFTVGTSTKPIKFTSDEIKQNITAGNQEYNGDVRYLSEKDMDNILAYAKEKGIEVVPMLNMPGHARVIVKNTDYGENGNLNVNSESARAYGYAILKKYVDYFSGKGCKYFHFGADESGYSGTNMTTFLTGCAKVITDAGMTPRAFNDATAVADMPKSVQVTYWHKEDGSKYANVLAQSHNLINTHGRWYYVIKTAQNSEIGTKYWQGTVNTTPVSVELPIMKATMMDSGTWVGLNEFFDGNPGYGSTISNNKGTMFCIWCDASQDAYLTDSDVISENENYGALYQLKKLAEHYWADDINKDPVDPVNPTEKVVNIKVGESVSYNVGDSTVDAGDKIVGNEAYIANAVVAKTEEVAETTVSTTKATTVEDGASYILRVYDTNYALTTNPGQTVWQESTPTLKFETYTAAEDDNVWTLEASDTGYKLNSKAGYLNLGAIVNNASVGTTGEVFELVYTSTGWTIKNPSELYINALGGVENYHSAGGWTDGSTRFDLYKVTQATNATTTLTITGTGEGTTIVTIGGIKYTINVTASDVTETKRLTYGGSFTLPTGAVVTEAPTSGVTVADGKVTAGNTDAEVTVKAVTKNAGGYVTKRYIYNVTVSNVDLSDVDPLSVELWITNTWVGENAAPTSVQSKTITAEEAYGEDGILLSSKVPTRGYKKDGSDVRVTYWKGVVLHNGVKPVQQGTDYSKAGDDFTRIRYYNDSWEYYYNNQWNALNLSTGKDTVVAYYLQINNVAPEITTGTQHYGNPPTSDPGYSAKGFTLTTFAVVYPDGSLSRTEDQMYNEGMIRGFYNGTSIDLGTIYAQNNSEYEISKITITWGDNKNKTNTTDSYGVTWYTGGTTYSSYGVNWDKVSNDAGVLWYDETVCWSAEDSEQYGEIPMIDDDALKFTKGGKNAALILIYLKPVQKETNLNVVYWDDNANTQINPNSIQIVVNDGVTYLTGLKNVTQLQSGTITLPDDAYITNSSGVDQKFNKDITILEGVAARYRSGLYTYVKADISKDGMTLTLHYDLKNKEKNFKFVVDFGLPIEIYPSDIGITEANTISKASLNKAGNLFKNTGEFGTATIGDGTGNTYNKLRYELNKPLEKIVTIPLFVTFKDGLTAEFSINIIPATNVLYEENFMAAGEGWTKNDTTVTNVKQDLEPAGAKTSVYGYDKAYKEQNTFSQGSYYTATLNKPTEKSYSETAGYLKFTFKGTGYDVISECGPNTGMLLVERWLNGKCKKVTFVDTSFYGDNTYIKDGDIRSYQIPVVREMNLTRDEYEIRVYGFVTKDCGAFTGGTAPASSANSMNDVALASLESDVTMMMDSIEDTSMEAVLAGILASHGIDEDDVEVEITRVTENGELNSMAVYSSENLTILNKEMSLTSAAETNENTTTSAVVYVDGFRVYQPISDEQTKTTVVVNGENTETTYYALDHEAGMKYASVYDSVLANVKLAELDSAVYVEYGGDKVYVINDGDTISENEILLKNYKRSKFGGGPQNEIYLTSTPGENGKNNYVAMILENWEPGNSRLYVSAKAVSGAPKLSTNIPEEEIVIEITINTSTELYYDITSWVAQDNVTGLYYVVIGNSGANNSVLSISAFRYNEKVKPTTNQAFIARLPKLLGKASVQPVFTPESFSISTHITEKASNQASIRISATADVEKFVLYEDSSLTKEVSMFYRWNNKTAFNRGRTKLKAYNLYFTAPADVGEYTYYVVAVDTNGNRSNPEAFVLTVTE